MSIRRRLRLRRNPLVTSRLADTLAQNYGAIIYEDAEASEDDTYVDEYVNEDDLSTEQAASLNEMAKTFPAE